MIKTALTALPPHPTAYPYGNEVQALMAQRHGQAANDTGGLNMGLAAVSWMPATRLMVGERVRLLAAGMQNPAFQTAIEAPLADYFDWLAVSDPAGDWAVLAQEVRDRGAKAAAKARRAPAGHRVIGDWAPTVEIVSADVVNIKQGNGQRTNVLHPWGELRVAAGSSVLHGREFPVPASLVMWKLGKAIMPTVREVLGVSTIS